MKPIMHLGLLSALFVFTAVLAAQTSDAPLNGEQVVDVVAPSVALLLAGNDAGELISVNSAIVIRSDGVLLTAYHGIKPAQRIQVRFKSGEIYDQVQLIGIDERRDVAALRIVASNLPAVTILDSKEAKAGAPVFVVSNGAALPWTASSGVLSSLRLADEVSGAGSGYRLLQFTASVSPGSSGGVLVNADGRALGMVVATLDHASQNVNFAVPLDAVFGLAALSGGTAYASGASLRLPAQAPSVEIAKPSEPRPALPEPSSAPTPAQQEPVNPLQAPDTANSQILESRDRRTILCKFRTIYIDSQSMWLKSNVMKSAIYKKQEFLNWGITVVDRQNLADVVLRIHLVGGTEDYTYDLQHINTSITLDSGKVTAVNPILWMSGNTAAPMIADALIRSIQRAGRPSSQAEPVKN